MKKILLIVLLMLAGESISFSQILDEYPFKTFLDRENSLYVTGYKDSAGTKDIFIAKYVEGISHPVIEEYFISPSGDDNAIDLAVDDLGNIVVVGYIYNINTNSNDIVSF